MTTTQKEQLRGNEATLVNSARAQFKAFRDKLSVILADADTALMQMDSQLEDFDVQHPERTEMTTTERKDAEAERDRRAGGH